MWLFKNMTESAAVAINGFLEMVGDMINNIFNACFAANQTSLVDQITKYCVLLALAVLAVMAVKSAISIYGLESEGDPEQSPVELVYRIGMAVCFIGSSSWIYSTTWNVVNLVADDVLRIPVDFDFRTAINQNIIDCTAQGTALSLSVVWVCLITVVCMVVLCIVAAKRGAELAMMKFLMPLFGIDFLTTDREKVKTFLTSFGITWGGYIIQLVMYKLFCYNMMNVHTNNTTNSLAALGCLLVALGTPKWLEKLLYSSGVTNGIKGGVRTAAYLAPQLLRMG